LDHLALPTYRAIRYEDFSDYAQLANMRIPDSFNLLDHLGGFTEDGYNAILDNLNKHARACNKVYNVYSDNVYSDVVCYKYPNLNIWVNSQQFRIGKTIHFENYTQHPELNYKNFICSFNGSNHVSRQLLVSIIKKFEYYNPGYCSKNFTYSIANIDGHINEYVPDQASLYQKFFIGNSEEFFQTVNSFGHVRFKHSQNIHNLENKLTESFLHIVSETLATSYVPFVTEKSFYSIVSRGLFLAYAQTGWHAHIEKYHGFKLYTNLFDYRFDSITNPVERLVELMTMIGKFSKLTPHEWHDLYLLESDAVEFNYDHYFSKDYLKILNKY
tara:strand:- start:885 stop:1868 length:984 start_codon:yes stop_codon:yes gene_type:complete